MDMVSVNEIFDHTTAGRRNDIAYMVSCRVAKDDADLKTKYEEAYYDRLLNQAEAHEKKYGFYPVFAMEEIDYDAPRLDIYSEPVK